MIVENLKQKVEQLVDKHQAALEQNKKLQLENANLVEQLNQKEEELNHLKENKKIWKLSEGVRSKGDSKEANLKINELVREIDKCIAQLNR